jgi:hypothetical protein
MIMRKRNNKRKSGILAAAAVAMSVFAGAGQMQPLVSQAEETVIEADAEENGQTGSEAMTGTYSAPEGWSVDDSAGSAEKTVYVSDASAGTESTSTITCSYLDTNYSVLEYEQLRDMLTNNLLYSNVNAQISASAVYTNAKDYLYILLVDDSSQDFRNIYCYVVGDYRCFCVEVKEYRTEAEQLRAQEMNTPQEVGQSLAESFVWGR